MRVLLSCLLALCGTMSAQIPGFGGRPGVVLSNGKIEFTVAPAGATVANLALIDDPGRLSPFGDPGRVARTSGRAAQGTPGLPGHFLFLDELGGHLRGESGAGYRSHDQANDARFEIIQSTKVGPVASVIFAAHLQPVHAFVTRTVRMVDNESVAYVDTEVESLVATDRLVSWAEHAAVAPPFFEPGKVIVDMPAGRCRVQAENPGSGAPLKEFDWPVAPLRKGARAGLVGCRVDPKRTYGYVTAFRRDKGLLFGYVFRRREFPWLVGWMNQAGNVQASHGIEFATQPSDDSRRETVEMQEVFGAPGRKLLPAKSKMRARFLFFYTRVPGDFAAVADVELENGRLRIKNQTGPEIVLDARLPL